MTRLTKDGAKLVLSLIKNKFIVPLKTTSKLLVTLPFYATGSYGISTRII